MIEQLHEHMHALLTLFELKTPYRIFTSQNLQQWDICRLSNGNNVIPAYR